MSYKILTGIKQDIATEDAGIVVVQDISEQERIQEVETTIGSMIVNLQKLKGHLVENGEGCKWCTFNLLNDIDALEGLLEKYAPKEPEEATA